MSSLQIEVKMKIDSNCIKLPKCLFNFFFIGDTLLITLTDHPGYSEFIYIAWIFAILFYIFTYMSLVMPKWLVDRIEK